MSTNTAIKFYGGPLHGQFREVGNRRRWLAPDGRFSKRSRFETPVYMGNDWNECTYEVVRFHEHHGNGYRWMDIAVIEGEGNLLKHEEWQIGIDIRAYHWTPKDEPNFITDFKRWIAWTTYRCTNYDSRYIHEELYGF